MANKITFPIFSVYIKSSKELLALSGLLLNPSKPFSHILSEKNFRESNTTITLATLFLWFSF